MRQWALANERKRLAGIINILLRVCSMDENVKKEVLKIVRNEIKEEWQKEQERLKKELMSEFNVTLAKSSKDMLKKIEEIILYNLPLALNRPEK